MILHINVHQVRPQFTQRALGIRLAAKQKICRLINDPEIRPINFRQHLQHRFDLFEQRTGMALVRQTYSALGRSVGGGAGE